MREEDKYMRFDHAAANVEEVPFVDEKIYTVRDKEQLIAAALSSRDTEIREVLERLQNLPTGEPMCWCRVRWQSGEHDGACEQAQSLYAKLQPPEKSLPGE